MEKEGVDVFAKILLLLTCGCNSKLKMNVYMLISREEN